MKGQVMTLDNKKAGDIDLTEAVFGLPARSDLLQRAVRWQLAKRRSGNHNTLNVREIRGTTAKPWRQKGSGRARQGSVRSTQFRGGAVAHGPRPRDHSFGLPKKVRRLALKTALSAKNAEGKLVIIDAAVLSEPSTASLARKFSVLGWSSALIIDGSKPDENFMLATNNLPNIDVIPEQGANVYDILRRDVLVLTKAAVDALQARLS